MKSFFSSRRMFVILFLIAAIALVACERQIQDEENVPGSPTAPILVPPALPTTDPALVPTVDPALVPTTDPALLPTTDPAAVATPDNGTGAPVTSPPTTEQVSYIVNAGDTLFSIARAYGITIEELAAANNLDPNGVLSLGQTLVIPVPGSVAQPTTDVTQPATGEQIHIVAPGENLFRIGLQYGFTVEELAAYNGIANPDYIDVGQEIRIPPGGNPQ
ncbi:MAG: LysM peptidoglycan-binding domain-containing protein [Candidatus Promineifilaceae bacterium]